MPHDRFDTRDAEEHAAIAAILEQLPADHDARRAYAAGADTIALTRLVGDRELAARLTQVFLDGRDRVMRRSRHFRP